MMNSFLSNGWAKKRASREVGLFFSFFIFHRLGCTEKIEENIFFSKNHEKTHFQSALISPLGGMDRKQLNF